MLFSLFLCPSYLPCMECFSYLSLSISTFSKYNHQEEVAHSLHRNVTRPSSLLLFSNCNGLQHTYHCNCYWSDDCHRHHHHHRTHHHHHHNLHRHHDRDRIRPLLHLHLDRGSRLRHHHHGGLHPGSYNFHHHLFLLFHPRVLLHDHDDSLQTRSTHPLLLLLHHHHSHYRIDVLLRHVIPCDDHHRHDDDNRHHRAAASAVPTYDDVLTVVQTS
mmetsp:Transcript_41440/g.86981  ORF Transcript_41440/g.86981 Transcript_41440/m.86981 type:complete len:215 (+) Transcript_41440:97-741(+)